jgi:hypothetical protein
MQLTRVHGVRAVLWHQGETDGLLGTSAGVYADLLKDVIAQSRKDAGWEVPWGVARASYHPSVTPERQAAVVQGQGIVISSVPGVFEGPSTDSYHTRGFLHDVVHFNAEGLAAHAAGWADALKPIIGSAKSVGKP